ncbi:unnamed protein product [Penicillium glandicola]
MYIRLATTILAEPTVTPTPTAVAIHHSHHQHQQHHHHHWSYIPRPLPSRKPCPVRSSSAVLSSSVIPTSTPHLSRVPSHSPRPHWSHRPKPSPHGSSSSAPSSVAIQTTSATVLTPVIEPSVVVSAPDSLSTGPSQLSGSPSQGATTELGSSSSQISISTSASDSITTIVASIPTSTPSGALQSSVPSGSSALELTTSTVFSTRTATITACPTTVPNCAASLKSTFVTTETILVSTTVCPATEAVPTQTAFASLSTTGGVSDYGHGNGGSDLTTSTVYSTRTATITACPSSVTNCPLRSKTTYLTTETLVVSTTICPVADATGTNGAVPTHATPSVTQVIGGDNGASEMTTSTIFATRTATVLACPESVTDCPLRSKTSYATTETFAVATTVYPIYPVYTSILAEAADAATVTVTVANPQATDVTSGAQSSPGATGSGSNVDTVYTTTIVVESCADDDTCTGYINTIVVTQTNTAGPTATPSHYTLHRGSGAGAGAGSSGAVSASSTHSWFPSSHTSGMATTTVPTTTNAVSPVYTGAASIDTRSSIMQIVGTMMVVLLAIYI